MLGTEHERLANLMVSDAQESFFYALSSSGPLRGPGERNVTDSSPSNSRTDWQAAILEFDDALLRFTNLESIQSICQRDHSQRSTRRELLLGWLSGRAQLYEAAQRALATSEETSAAAYTAFMLRCLGWRSHFSRTLTSLSLVFCSQFLLDPLEFDEFWNDDSDLSDSEQPGRGRMRGQQQLVLDAFRHLKYLALVIFVKPSQFPNTPAVVASWISKAEQLEYLHFRLLPCGRLGQGTMGIDALDKVVRILDLDSESIGGVRTKRYLKLKELKLTTTITAQTLLSLLSSSSQTLQRLELDHCVAINPNESWPQIFNSMRGVPFEQLQHFAYRACVYFH